MNVVTWMSALVFCAATVGVWVLIASIVRRYGHGSIRVPVAVALYGMALATAALALWLWGQSPRWDF